MQVTLSFLVQMLQIANRLFFGERRSTKIKWVDTTKNKHQINRVTLLYLLDKLSAKQLFDASIEDGTLFSTIEGVFEIPRVIG
ncbi:MAG TPA: hypothetical protein VK369_12605 [Segetibacter sp.]|nr:hypothetical protein [Segetibacter sp.]